MNEKRNSFFEKGSISAAKNSEESSPKKDTRVGGTPLSKSALLRKIQELAFVKTELELFLDTHPASRVAMDYYHKAITALQKCMTEYQAEFGPILAESGVREGKWAWGDMPWPWQNSETDDTEEK